MIWPVYVNFTVDEWNSQEMEAYAKQASLIAEHVLMINPIDYEPLNHGGAFHFCNGKIIARLPVDQEGISNLFRMDKYYSYNDMCGWIYLFPQSEQDYQETIQRLVKSPVTSLIQVCIIAPVVEEILMRGFVLGLLYIKTNLGKGLTTNVLN